MKAFHIILDHRYGKGREYTIVARSAELALAAARRECKKNSCYMKGWRVTHLSERLDIAIVVK